MGGMEVKRFEYYWVREWWHPETQALIQSWGDALAVVLLETVNRKVGAETVSDRVARIESAVTQLEQLRARTSPESIRGSPTEPEFNGDWSWFRHDVYSCSGVGVVAPIEQLALLVAERFERVDLAQRLVEIDAFFEPEDAGIGAAHLLAETGRRDEGIQALLSVVDAPARSASARVHAVACLKALEADELDSAVERLWRATEDMKEGDASLVQNELRSIMDAA